MSNTKRGPAGTELMQSSQDPNMHWVFSNGAHVGFIEVYGPGLQGRRGIKYRVWNVCRQPINSTNPEFCRLINAIKYLCNLYPKIEAERQAKYGDLVWKKKPTPKPAKVDYQIPYCDLVSSMHICVRDEGNGDFGVSFIRIGGEVVRIGSFSLNPDGTYYNVKHHNKLLPGGALSTILGIPGWARAIDTILCWELFNGGANNEPNQIHLQKIRTRFDKKYMKTTPRVRAKSPESHTLTLSTPIQTEFTELDLQNDSIPLGVYRTVGTTPWILCVLPVASTGTGRELGQHKNKVYLFYHTQHKGFTTGPSTINTWVRIPDGEFNLTLRS